MKTTAEFRENTNTEILKTVSIQYGAKEIKEFMRKSVLIGFLFSLLIILVILLSSLLMKKNNVLENNYLINANKTIEITKIDENTVQNIPLDLPKEKIEFSDVLTTKFIAGLPKPVADDKAISKEFTDFNNLNTSLSTTSGREIDLNNVELNINDNIQKKQLVQPIDNNVKEQVFESYEVERPVQVDLTELQSKVVYPEMAIQAKIEGRVLLEVTIDKSGKVFHVNIASSSSNILDKAAIDAVYKTNFLPALQNGIPVKSKLIIPIQFKIR